MGDATILETIGDRIECPCQHFTAMSKIVGVLDSQESMKSLLDWLEGRTDVLALAQNRQLSCGKRSRCRFRYGTSIAILNAIRDACRPYLEPTSASSSAIGETTEGFSRSPSSGPAVPYEDAFPSLHGSKPSKSKPHPAASNFLVPRKKSVSNKNNTVAFNAVVPRKKTEEKMFQNEPKQLQGKQKKTKRRIRPQLAGTIDTSSSAWGQQSKPSTTSGSYHDGNIASLPSQDPLTIVKKLVAPAEASRLVMSVESPKTKPSQPSVSPSPSPRTPIKGEDSATDVIKKSPEEHIDHLVDIYIALIKNLLVPSTALELHLLIRLLALNPEVGNLQTPITSAGMSLFFQSIFSSSERCRRFSQVALFRLQPILRNLAAPLIKLMIQCEPIRKTCPKLADDLNNVLQERMRQGALTEHPSEAVTGTHAILSLPFEKDRDSRHNYKTQTEVAIYKNREASRDAFLYQLRAFMSVKGKMLGRHEMEQAQERVRLESKHIMNGLMSVNMIWFAQFFCELLLQIGLSPVEETDQELLSIADKGKLQRLHKRFSSRGSNANKSSKKLVLSQRMDTSALSPVTEAHTYFTGYQEFFFLVVSSADNYNFGIHLRSRMTTTMVDLATNLSVNVLERRLLELQLFARFLGFLIFSPNWHGAGIDFNKIQSSALDDGLQQLESLGLSPINLVEEAWKTGHMISVVPWVTELLKMAKWDSLSQTSRRFRQLLANLRKIQRTMSFEDVVAADRFGPSMQMISFCLEKFFNETTGLPKLTSLPQSTLPVVSAPQTDSLDRHPIGFSIVTLFDSSPQLEDLSDLMNSLNRAPFGKSPGKARKLRPSIVSRGVSLEPNRLFSDSTVDLKSLPIINNLDNSKASDIWGRAPWGDGKNIQTKLANAFFHQHRDIKEICEFVVKQVLKNASGQVLGVCIKPVFDELKVTMESPESAFEDAQARALEVCNEFVEKRLTESLKSSLTLLGPPGLHPQVLEIAVTLSVTRGVHSGRALLHALVANESNLLRESFKREQKQLQTSKAPTLKKEKEPATLKNALNEMIVAIQSLQCYLRTPSAEWHHEDVNGLLHCADSHTAAFIAAVGNTIPSEASLRGLFEIVLDIDRVAQPYICWCLKLSHEQSCSVLFLFLRLATHLCRFTSYGLRHLCLSEVLHRLIPPSATSESDDEVASLLVDMVRTRMVSLSRLQTCLESTEKDAPTHHIALLVDTRLNLTND